MEIVSLFILDKSGLELLQEETSRLNLFPLDSSISYKLLSGHRLVTWYHIILTITYIINRAADSVAFFATAPTVALANYIQEMCYLFSSFKIFSHDGSLVFQN